MQLARCLIIACNVKLLHNYSYTVIRLLWQNFAGLLNVLHFVTAALQSDLVFL